MKYAILLILVTISCLSPLYLGAQDSAREHLDNYMRVRGDASGEETVFYWTGSVYSMVQGERRRELFKFSGFNIARTLVEDDGFEMLTREAAFYLHPQTGQILDSWRNPFTDETLPVVHIWNDPVNFSFIFDDEQVAYVPRILPTTDLGEQIVFHSDIFPFYDSPLPRKEYPDYSQSDIYQAAEFFQFFVDKEDLENMELSTVPVSIAWTRISPWMPFMKMGDRQGSLFFSCRGVKLPGGYEDLPVYIKDYVAQHNPHYSTAPTEYESPNETSWSYFKKLIDLGQYPR